MADTDTGGLLARLRSNARVRETEAKLEEQAKKLNAVKRQANEILKEETSVAGLAVGSAMAGAGGGAVAVAEEWGPVLWESDYMNVDSGHLVQLVTFGGSVLTGDRTMANLSKGAAGANVYRAVRKAMSYL